jgi:hypothetical protein
MLLLSWLKIYHYIVRAEEKSFDKGMSKTSTVAIKNQHFSLFFFLPAIFKKRLRQLDLNPRS